MARNLVGMSIGALAVVFLVVIVAFPFLRKLVPSVSGFQDQGEGAQCEEGREPCPEGFFCSQRTCVPILPRYNVNDVTGYGS